MEEPLSSKALEANLAETRAEEIVIPPEHQRLINLSDSHWGINQRTREFILEYHHPYFNPRFVVERWREIMLRDQWFYCSLEDSAMAFGVLIDISGKLFSSDISAELRGTIVQTLLEFTGALFEKGNVDEWVIRKVLDALRECLEKDEQVTIRYSRYFKTYLSQAAEREEFAEEAFSLTRKALSKSIHLWEANSDVESWFRAKQGLFYQDYTEEVSAIGKPFFADLNEALERARDWPDLKRLPSFDDIAARFRDSTDRFNMAVEKIYFIVYLLRLSGMEHLRENLLTDINRLLGDVHDELSGEDLVAFSENLFSLFQELKAEHNATVMDCLLNLGQQVIDTGDQELIDAFEDSIIQFGFVTPGEIVIDSDWQVRSDVNHIKNIRVWMELIGYAPSRMEMLLAALIVNLRLEGVFVSDTDIFQRDITRFLNSDVGPVYKQVKDLARIFPVYFSEIGAEGELRDVTTQIDEMAYRKDRLIHFLRKQTHTESNSTHLDLVKQIVRFWYDGSREGLIKLLPADVLASIDVNGEWYTPVNRIIRGLCQNLDCAPEELVDADQGAIENYLLQLTSFRETDIRRVRLLLRIWILLREKYSFEVANLRSMFKRYRFFRESDVEELADLLAQGDRERTLRLVYRFMSELKRVILDPEPGESIESIYHKRHVAAGIPSVYGRYQEPKFDAMGLTFRLEEMAQGLIEGMIQDINLNYVTIGNLRMVSDVLSLFREGLELDGVSHQRFNANLRMLQSSFISASCSLDQYTNMFEFLERNVKEIIDEYFLSVYDKPLKMIIPQHIPNKHHLGETEVRQILHRRSEEFYRGMLSSTFLVQALDNFINSTLNALRHMSDRLPAELIRDVMTYDPRLVISSLSEAAPQVDNQIFLGAKAYFLKAMLAAGFPVPEGFVLTTEVFRHRQSIMKHPHISGEIEEFIWRHIRKLEEATGHRFGDPDNPLLFSVRSGTAMSMPGAMSTLLNVGMNDRIADGLSRQPGWGRTAWDCYRRLLQSWGMTGGIEREVFDAINERFESRYKIRRNIDFTPDQMREVALEYRNALSRHGIEFEEDTFLQLRQAIIMVMDSWYSERAKVFRKHLQIAEEWGTAVIVQKMVMGNLNERSGTGVLLTHDPYEVKPGINPYGDFRLCSQGEDVVTGWLHTLPVTEYHRKKYQYEMDFSLQSSFPEIYRKLIDLATLMVDEYDLGPQEIEFTFESESPEDLYILQARRLEVRKYDRRFVFSVPYSSLELVGRGIGIGGGALSGVLAFDMEDLQHFAETRPDWNLVLVRPDTVPDDIGMIFKCDGLLTGKGGATSHAAVTAVRLGKVCVVGCTDLMVNEAEKSCTVNGVLFRSGDEISIEGYLGNVYKGSYPREFVDIT
ncbi:MAG: PEP/pyruvate-binding domain-containing protein [Dehalococcoidia bacterium]